MRIYSMTATFGKLEHETLTLKPGMNILQAPNEWGKSTWCAFLLAMLYGLDSRKTGRGSLTDREHYAPWSGSPMSGRMDIRWHGRDITIERTSKGRIPMGTFRAFETESGLDVPELTAANCGQLLLGVERSVYRRAGFIRLADLPVTDDDALRSRLNALVTTGDESGDGILLEKGLKELKNRCRYNRSGLLPQAEQERAALRASLKELDTLRARETELNQELEQAKQRQQELENHSAALAYAAARRSAQALETADADLREAERRQLALEKQCSTLPSLKDAEGKLRQLNAYREELQEFQLRQQLPAPHMPQVPRPFVGMEPEEAIEQATEESTWMRSRNAAVWGVLMLLAAICFTSGVVLAALRYLPLAAVGVVLGLGLAAISLLRRQGEAKSCAALTKKYGSAEPDDWVQMAQMYSTDMARFHQAEADYRAAQEKLRQRQQVLKQRRTELCGTQSITEAAEDCEKVCAVWQALFNARRDAQQAARQRQAVASAVQSSTPPVNPDSLTCTAEQTKLLLQENQAEQQRLTHLLGEYRGRMASHGQEAELNARLEAVDARIASLEQYHSALTLAQRTLEQATAELQRRFAPRISRRAQSLMHSMTAGRYDRLSLSSDLTLQAGAVREDVLHEAAWRSEGTIDQLYLSLRLAVAEELTPNAPLVLDDVFVRFDEDRMKAALKIVSAISETRQVLLFTCQDREIRATRNAQ